MDEITRTQRSRTLSMWLRHKPERGGLTLSKEGWAAIPAVLEAFEKQEQPLTRAEFDEIVRLDPKGRYEVEGSRVRARYGHSLELEEKPHPGMPPATLYHGTPRRYVPNIIQRGLRPMKRQYVHLSPDKATAREVGKRRDQQPAILSIAAHAAHADGVQFYPRGKGIWLSDPIPPRYLTVLDEGAASPARGWVAEAGAPPQAGEAGRPAGSPRPPLRKAARDAAPGEPRRRRPKGGFVKPDR